LAREVKTWSAYRNLGLVLGATFPDQLKSVREICPEMPFLIPGVGVQGGDLEAAIQNGSAANGRGAIINSSRAIIYASQGPDFAQAARREAAKLRDAINAVLAAEGKGWP
jgi:orotidine-5'-phosphate decarboxylase